MPATLKPGPVPSAAKAGGRRIPIALPRPALPAGLKSSAVLWQLAAAGAGFLLAGGRVPGGGAPFGLACVLGCAPGYALSSAAGVALGSLVRLPGRLALSVVSALPAVLAARLLLPGQARGARRFAPDALACAMLLATQAAGWALYGSAPAQLAAALETAALAVGLGRAVHTFPVQAPRGRCLWLGMLIACVQSLPAFGLAPGLFLLAAAALCTVWAGPPAEGLAVSALWALALAAAAPELCGAALGAAAAATVGAAAGRGARACCAGIFAAVFAALLLMLPRPAPWLPALLSAWLGAALFALLPGGWLQALAPLPAGEAVPPVVDKSATAAVAGRLSAAAAALADVADIINAVCDRRLPPRGESFNYVVDYTAHRLCQGCQQRERCWLHSYSGMVDGLYHLKAPLEARGRVEIEDLKGMLSTCCHPSDLCRTVAHGYRLWRSRRQSRARAATLRTALTDQYAAVAGTLANLAQRLGRAGLPDPQREAQAARLFAGLGLEALECSVTNDLYGRINVRVTVARAAFAPDELAALTQELGHSCHRDLALPEVYSHHAVTTLAFAERPLYRAVFGAANRAATGQEVSGDACDHFCDADGHARLLLCDGMGTGRAAAVEGRMAVRLMAQLLQAGIAAEDAARLVNAALGLQGFDEESAATLDLWTVDLYTGRAIGYKAGAAASFLVRDGVPRMLESGGGLPLGVLDTVTGHGAALTLGEGDILVAVSDGVLANGPDRLLQQLGASVRLGHTPAQLAQAMVDGAVERAGGAWDDCTVLALQLLRA